MLEGETGTVNVVADEAQQLRAMLESSFEERCSRSFGKVEDGIIECWIAESRERIVRAADVWLALHGIDPTGCLALARIIRDGGHRTWNSTESALTNMTDLLEK